MRRREPRNEFIRGPKWRTRAAPGRRATGVVVTVAAIAAVGLVIMALPMWLLDRLGAPTWLITMPWWAARAAVG